MFRPTRGNSSSVAIPRVRKIVLDDELYVSGAKMHQTGAVNSHWLIFMPTMRMTERDRDWITPDEIQQ